MKHTDPLADQLLKQMTDLYTAYCLPRITFNTITYDMQISYVWTSKEAEDMFEKSKNMLIEIKFKEQQSMPTIKKTKPTKTKDKSQSNSCSWYVIGFFLLIAVCFIAEIWTP